MRCLLEASSVYAGPDQTNTHDPTEGLYALAQQVSRKEIRVSDLLQSPFKAVCRGADSLVNCSFSPPMTLARLNRVLHPAGGYWSSSLS